MGIAIIIPDADFSEKNLGNVTFIEDVDVAAITILGSNTYEGLTAQLNVGYTPAHTSQRGVTWSVTAGNQYATIDSGTGVLTILEGANSSSVTVKAVSAYNTSVFASKTLSVTYSDAVEQLDAIAIIEKTAPELNKKLFEVMYTPSNTAHKGVSWSVTAGSNYATINNLGVLTVLNTAATEQQVTVKAVSTYNPALTANKTVAIKYVKEPAWDLSQRWGAMVAVDLAVAMNGNRTSFLLEFAEDSAEKGKGDSDSVLFSLGQMNDNFLYNTANLGLHNVYHNMDLHTSLLRSTGYVNESSKMTYIKDLHGGHTECWKVSGGESGVTANQWIIVSNNGLQNLFSYKQTEGEIQNCNSGINSIKYFTFGFKAATNAAFTANSVAQLIESSKQISEVGNPRPCFKAFKIKTFIIVPGTFTTPEEIKAARADAYVDIKINGSGLPYNAGSTGILYTATPEECGY